MAFSQSHALKGLVFLKHASMCFLNGIADPENFILPFIIWHFPMMTLISLTRWSLTMFTKHLNVFTTTFIPKPSLMTQEQRQSKEDDLMVVVVPASIIFYILWYKTHGTFLTYYLAQSTSRHTCFENFQNWIWTKCVACLDSSSFVKWIFLSIRSEVI